MKNQIKQTNKRMFSISTRIQSACLSGWLAGYIHRHPAHHACFKCGEEVLQVSSSTIFNHFECPAHNRPSIVVLCQTISVFTIIACVFRLAASSLASVGDDLLDSGLVRRAAQRMPQHTAPGLDWSGWAPRQLIQI